MAGSGMALRLHEFKERNAVVQEQRAVLRQGRDVNGMYPGQIGRVHVIPSPWRRKSQPCVKGPQEGELTYRRNFDLLTLRALEQRVIHTPQTPPTSYTVYQQEFGLQAHLYPPDDTKMTLISHPSPLHSPLTS